MSRRWSPDYRHVPGNHCGSTALRNLLAHAGVELTEEMVFGLGAGACFYYVVIDDQRPSRFFNGRTAQLEAQFCELTGLPLELETFDGPDASWEAARDAVDDGRPPLLITDLFYLDHYGNSAHFPGHAVVLAGYDDEVAYLSDTSFDELQTTRLENLAKARHGRHPIFPLDGHMLAAPPDAELSDPRAAAPAAIARAAKRMLEPAMAPFDGMPALERFAAEVGQWPEQADDWQWCARFGYQVIERRGTGGGNFRLMYSRFLAEAGYRGRGRAGRRRGRALDRPRLARSSAPARSDEPDPAVWARVGERRGRGAEAEQRLWDALGSARYLSSFRTARSIFSRSTNSPGSDPATISLQRSADRLPAVVTVEDARIDVGLPTDGRGVVEIRRYALDGFGRRPLSRGLRLGTGAVGGELDRRQHRRVPGAEVLGAVVAAGRLLEVLVDVGGCDIHPAAAPVAPGRAARGRHRRGP